MFGGTELECLGWETPPLPQLDWTLQTPSSTCKQCSAYVNEKLLIIITTVLASKEVCQVHEECIILLWPVLQGTSHTHAK